MFGIGVIAGAGQRQKVVASIGMMAVKMPDLGSDYAERVRRMRSRSVVCVCSLFERVPQCLVIRCVVAG